MNERHVFYALVGVLGLSLAFHGGIAAYGFYHLRLILEPPAPANDAYVRWARENYGLFLTILIAIAVLCALYLVACFGFARKASWSSNAWLLFSGTVVALYLGSLASGVAWTRHFPELVLSALSCWYLLRRGALPQRAGHLYVRPMFKRCTIVKFALWRCMHRLGIPYSQSENSRLRFFDSTSYDSPNGRSDDVDVVVWPERIEVLEYSTDPRELPCTAQGFTSLSAFLRARTKRQVERSAQIWAMTKVHQAAQYSPDAMRDAFDESCLVSERLTANMGQFIQRSVFIQLAARSLKL
ncbi:hypothetical protein [Ramlibacter pallidus]|uniref:Uncharacterized protein n=1 Tax=Ramlibacter pallidus TaxID=2780087 RepID=A0ABR9RY86_9BURK|nr:hypothetical protein [Ramlibacter pallidus]MBE7366207.1 hypothetical protein [Ramlibacter pallidus]